MRLSPTLLLAAAAAFASGCSQITWRQHTLPEMTPPRHPLPAEAKTFKVVVEAGSVEVQRLASSITVPGLERVAIAQPEVSVAMEGSHRIGGVVVSGNGGGGGGGGGGAVTVQGPHGERVTVGGEKARDLGPETDVVLTVLVGPASGSGLEVKERPAVPGAPVPVMLYSYGGTWQIPQKFVIAMKGQGEIDSYTNPATRTLCFDADPVTGRPFPSRGGLEAAWAIAQPTVGASVAKSYASTFIEEANGILADHFTWRSSTVAVDLVEEHKRDPRFAEAARAFDVATSMRMRDPAGFAERMAKPIAIWESLSTQPPGTDEGERREAAGAATFNLAVAHLVLDDLDLADNLALSAQSKGIEATEIRFIRGRIADRRERLAAQPAPRAASQ